MANTNYQNVGYSLTQGPLTTLSALPIVGRRAPTTADKNYQIGQLWVLPSTNAIYGLSSVVNNLATWTLLSNAGGGAGVFSSLTVTPGPISLTGTTGINTSGAGVTTINTGGTGALLLGNATGNTVVTGSLTATSIVSTTTVTAGTGMTSTTGNITATAGAVNAGTTMTAGTGITSTIGNIIASAGDVRGVGAVATGDNAGVAATTSLTNINAPVTSGGGTGFIVTPITGTATTASTGFIKLYLGTTAIFVPYWLATA